MKPSWLAALFVVIAGGSASAAPLLACSGQNLKGHWLLQSSGYPQGKCILKVEPSGAFQSRRCMTGFDWSTYSGTLVLNSRCVVKMRYVRTFSFGGSVRGNATAMLSGDKSQIDGIIVTKWPSREDRDYLGMWRAN